MTTDEDDRDRPRRTGEWIPFLEELFRGETEGSDPGRAEARSSDRRRERSADGEESQA